MTNCDDAGKAGDRSKTSSKKNDRQARSARALRENLKKRKQQLKARETSKN
ncbi:MAG: hypothetical protein ACFE0S_01225 [Rhodospirillales bacterium]